MAAGCSPQDLSASMAKTFAPIPAFMSAPPRPYSQSPSSAGSKGGRDHMSCGPSGTTSMCPFRISDRPVVCRGLCVPTTLTAFS